MTTTEVPITYYPYVSVTVCSATRTSSELHSHVSKKECGSTRFSHIGGSHKKIQTSFAFRHSAKMNGKQEDRPPSESTSLELDGYETANETSVAGGGNSEQPPIVVGSTLATIPSPTRSNEENEESGADPTPLTTTQQKDWLSPDSPHSGLQSPSKASPMGTSPGHGPAPISGRLITGLKPVSVAPHSR
jgi:hypothetical protein